MVKKAKYEIIKKFDNIEIRKYPELLLAVVEGYKGDSGFNLLFNYISGNNKTQKKISMTAPVITSEKIEMTAPVITSKDYMAFVMPEDYSLNTIPQPNNSEINIIQKPKAIYAVIRFSGVTNKKRIRKYSQQLVSEIEQLDLKTKDEPILMRYNSPFAPGFIRRNELAIEIKNY